MPDGFSDIQAKHFCSIKFSDQIFSCIPNYYYVSTYHDRSFFMLRTGLNA
ncbi:hypothetical protein ECP02989426_4755 [Escherichia coli P0298942.6]|nr:hypothetical protein ECP02989426_4755 [Escherichia coli P0298942.6]END36553.1 hypothetical protein EC2733950_4676 [Escherichia coli 2733950]